jgi:hypothetical protein
MRTACRPMLSLLAADNTRLFFPQHPFILVFLPILSTFRDRPHFRAATNEYAYFQVTPVRLTYYREQQ